ncbi:MAG: hypothetical protein IT384_34110 [Deltaproteobacteria bacterium]|nr:hypothetical protein [Deltaproteobacteria bacterium]
MVPPVRLTRGAPFSALPPADAPLTPASSDIELIQGVPGSLGLESERLAWRAGRLDPAACRAKIVGLVGLMRAAASELERTGLTKKVEGRLTQLTRAFEEATRPEVKVHAQEASSELVEAILQWRSLIQRPPLKPGQSPAALTPLASLIEERFPWAEAKLAAREAQEMVLDANAEHAAALLSEPLSEHTKRLTLWHEGPLSDRALSLLLEQATASSLERLTLYDLSRDRTLTLTAGEGRWISTDAELAARAPTRLTWSASVDVEQIESALARARADGITSLVLALQERPGQALAPDISRAIQRLIAAADGHLAVRLLGPERGELAALEGGALRIADPKVWNDHPAAWVTEVSREALRARRIDSLHIARWGGFHAGRSSGQLWIPGDAHPGAASAASAPLLTQGTVRALAPLELRAEQITRLDTCYAAALRHHAATVGDAHLGSAGWQEIAAAVGRYARVPSQARLLFEVLDRLERFSENNRGDGLGMPRLEGHAQESNAFHLLSMIASAPTTEVVTHGLREVQNLLGPVADRCVMRGACVGIVHDALLSEDRRRYSANNELRRLIDLKTEMRRAAAMDPGAEYELAALPTDRTQGSTSTTTPTPKPTPTPDFVVRRKTERESDALFVDAKELDARRMAEKGSEVERGVHQVLEHRYRGGTRRQGMLAIHLRCSAAELPSHLETLRRHLQAARRQGGRERSEVWVRVVAGTPEGKVTVTLDPQQGWRPSGDARGLFELLGWVAR